MLLFFLLPSVSFLALCLIMQIRCAVICFHIAESRQAIFLHSWISLSYGIH